MVLLLSIGTPGLTLPCWSQPTPQIDQAELSSEVYLDKIRGEPLGLLTRADQEFARHDWSEGIETLIRLADETEADKLVPVPIPETSSSFHSTTYLPVRSYVSRRILAFDNREGLDHYRRRVDPLAVRWLEEGRRTRNSDVLLERIVRERMPSGSGPLAASLLADRALERGEFEQARTLWESINEIFQWETYASPLPFWQRILRGESVPSVQQAWNMKGDLHSPPKDELTPASIAEIWSRLVLISLLEGNELRAKTELELLEQTWPHATGLIAGKQVPLGETLRKMLAASRAWPRTHPNHVTQQNLDFPLKPTWQVPLTETPLDLTLQRAYGLATDRAGETSEALCSHFPVVSGNHVFLRDRWQLQALDLATGEYAWSPSNDGVFYRTSGIEPTDGSPRPARSEPMLTNQLGPPRFTLTAHRSTLSATFLQPTHEMRTSNDTRPVSPYRSTLVAFDVAAEGALRFDPIVLPDPDWTCLGPPTIDKEICWIILRKHDTTAQDFVASFDLRTGVRRWQTRLSSADTIGRGMVDEAEHGLLTHHEGKLYYSNRLGSVAAIDARSGDLLWLTTYARSGPRRDNLLNEPWHTQRDLVHGMVYDGLFIVAPADSRYLMAFHIRTGQIVWQTELARDATRILGISDGQLVVSGRRLWWLDPYTGKRSPQVSVNPFPANEFAGPTGFGQGLISNKRVYWPTRDDQEDLIHVLDLQSGHPLRQPIDLTTAGAESGNLILAQDYLLIASPSRLYAFRLK